MRQSYPSDITLEQFSVIRGFLETAKKVTRPQVIDLYLIFCAVLYRLREGCRWRSLPHDFPKWQICYYHYNTWRHAKEGEESVLDRVMRELVEKERIIDEREPETTMIIIDSKSVKNTDTAEEKGFDAGKKVSGIKLHIGVDTLGLPHAMFVSTANVTDRNGAISMIGYAAPHLSSCLKVLADGGYTGDPFAIQIKDLIGADVEVVKRNELHKFAVLPKRWIVERTFGWLEDYRLLWKNCERKIHNTLQAVKMALISLLLRRY
jgi:transposase